MAEEERSLIDNLRQRGGRKQIRHPSGFAPWDGEDVDSKRSLTAEKTIRSRLVSFLQRGRPTTLPFPMTVLGKHYLNVLLASTF
jgi:hypothetical protein